MSKDKNECCQNFYKGKNEGEIKDGYNQKWVEILKNCCAKKIQKLSKKDCGDEDKHAIINPAVKRTCSAEGSGTGNEK